jgi:hypothetical protein
MEFIYLCAGLSLIAVIGTVVVLIQNHKKNKQQI